MKKLFGLLPIMVLLAACGPSQSAIQTASVKTQTAMPSPTPTTDPMAVLAGVCQGIPETEAADYRADHAHHKVHIISISNEGSSAAEPDWNSQVPRKWLAETVSEVEIVVCRAEKETLLENCIYLPTSYAHRYQYDTTIRLVAARSGDEILSFVQPGTPPESCPSSMTVDLYSGKTLNIYGGHVSFPDVQGNLGLYIESPTQPRTVLTDVDLGLPALSPDGSTLATVSFSGRISLWDSTTGQLLSTFTESLGSLLSIAFSPDNTQMGIGSYYEGMITVLDLQSEHISQWIQNPENNPVRSLVYSPDGRFLVSSSLDQIVFWDANSMEEVDRMDGPYPTNLAFSPDGSKLAVSGFSGVTILNMAADDKNPTIIEEWPIPSDDVLSIPFRAIPLAFSPDNRLLVYAACQQVEWPPCGGSEIRRWDLSLKDWSTALTVPTNIFDIQQLDISGDGSMVVGTYCMQFRSGCLVSGISLWDMATGARLYSFEQVGGVYGAVFAANNHTLIIVKEKELVFVDISWLR